ncbi:MAG: hypothetical protein QW334_01705 [Thermofilum sp.]
MIKKPVRAVVERELTREDFDSAVREAKFEKLYLMYEEEGDEALHKTIREEIPADVVHRLLSKRMRELVEVLSRSRGESITRLASILGRSVPNVYRDLKFLEKYKLVRFEERGRERVPTLTLKRIVLSFG